MPDAIDELLQVGQPRGPSVEDALAQFTRLRSTPDEGRAIRRLLVRHAVTPLPEPLLLAITSALIDRGEEGTAAAALSGASSLAALVVRADLLERSGDLAGAVALIERVLSEDIDWPGARERHARWRTPVSRPERRAEAIPAVVQVEPNVFRVLREVARGGAGIVYEAEDRELGRRVALKVYHRPDRDAALLLHEARVAVALAGEGIVRVFDADPRRGWVVLEWAPLGALRTLLRSGGGAAAAGRVASWAPLFARTLARVHSAGWVHRDIKPANLLFQAAGVPVLTDFGTAARVGAPGHAGSFGYTSPERRTDRPSDPRDDVYGFGRVLEEALDAAAEAEPREHRKWRELAKACTGPEESRPRDGMELVLALG